MPIPHAMCHYEAWAAPRGSARIAAFPPHGSPLVLAHAHQTSRDRPPLKVLITCDVELWPIARGWPQQPLPPERMGPQAFHEEIAFYRAGRTRQGCFGLDFQLDVLARHRLKGVFFVEPLASERVGADDLRRVVDAIQGRDQDIGLHLHPEWLGDFAHASIERGYAPGMHALDASTQARLIGHGLARLRAAGATRIDAFRAGGFLADRATLSACAAHGLRYDSSLDALYDASLADLPQRLQLTDAARVDDIIEVPMTLFRAGDGRLRHAQICACSCAELTAALERAHAAGRQHFTILLHNRELLAGPRNARPYRLLVRRFERLCAWLAERRASFETVHFRDLDASAISAAPTVTHEPLRIPRLPTLERYVEQALSRLI